MTRFGGCLGVPRDVAVKLARYFWAAGSGPVLHDGGTAQLFTGPGSARHDYGAMSIVGTFRIDAKADLGAALGLDAASTDANLILTAYRRWGLDFFDHLEGDYAFALWDGDRARLVLARDPIGHRPLHVAGEGSAIFFSSRPLPLARAIGRCEPDLVRVAAFVSLLPEYGEASFFAGVRRILPGHALVVERGAARDVCFWRPDTTPLNIGYDEAVERASAELDRAVLPGLAGPVAANQLSGGLDSSMIMVSAARQRRAGQRLVAITGFAEDPDGLLRPTYDDEANVAAVTAAGFAGVEHVLAGARAEGPLDALDRWLPTLERPLLNACNLGWIDATYAAAHDAGAETLLHGLMGNFTLSYEGLSSIPVKARSGHLLAAWREARAYGRYSGARWSGSAVMAFGWALPPSIFLRLAALRGAPARRVGELTFLRPDTPTYVAMQAFARHHRFDLTFRLPSGDRANTIIRELQWADPGLFNLSAIDRFGIDLIDATAGRRLVEYCLRLPSDHYFRDGQPRQLARAMLRDKVPSRVTDEKRRGQQGINWRRGAEQSRDALIGEVDLAKLDRVAPGLFDLPAIRRELVDWPATGWESEQQMQFYRRDLLRAVGALRFLRFVRESA